jgi:hypothetical protein
MVASIVLKITPRHGPHGKHRPSVVKNECLLARYLAMDICEPPRKLLLRNWFYCCVRVFRALPINGSTYHNTERLFWHLISNKTYVLIFKFKIQCTLVPSLTALVSNCIY